MLIELNPNNGESPPWKDTELPQLIEQFLELRQDEKIPIPLHHLEKIRDIKVED